MRDPAKTFARGMWVGGMRIGCPHNLAEEDQRRVGELILLQDGIEGDIFAVMAQFTAQRIVNGSVPDARPIGRVGQKDNSAWGSINFRISHGQATRSTFTFSRVTHFIGS